MSDLERLCDLLFEVSNEDRIQILLQLQEKPMRVSNLSRKLDLSIQVVSRHVTRLGEVGLVKKDVEGYYSLTPFGESILNQLQEFYFLSKHRDYFITHYLSSLPVNFVRLIGDLSNSTYVNNVMDFLHCVENIIKEAEKEVLLLVDQYPISALVFIEKALDRGVKFRCIEPEKGVSSPVFNFSESEDIQALRRARTTPLVEHRTLGAVNIFLFSSEKRCALAFPTQHGEFDYRGFTAKNEMSLKWCRDLFQHYWENAEPKVYITATDYLQPIRMLISEEEKYGQIVVEGRDDSNVDAKAVQDAVNKYDDIVLRGAFNFGTHAVKINRSVVVRGEGRKDDVPATKIYKKNWVFPFTEFDSIFTIEGEGAEVVLENIHFMDFNCSCIYGLFGKSLKIKNNMITLGTGYGRGWKYGLFGDVITGIWLDTPTERLLEEKNFPGGVSIEGNYLDFAFEASTAASIPIAMGPFARDPEYRPDLINHEYYIGIGINVLNISGKVVIERNTVLNMNARGICVTDSFASADVRIKHNVIKSDKYGSYPFNGTEAGAGIFAQDSFMYRRPGFNVEIEDNVIQLVKPNYCGIGVFGLKLDDKDIGGLFSGTVINNRIHLEDGLSGIHINSKNFEVFKNKISGNAFFGVQTTGLKKSKDLELESVDVSIKENDVTELKIREPGLARVRRRRSTE